MGLLVGNGGREPLRGPMSTPRVQPQPPTPDIATQVENQSALKKGSRGLEVRQARALLALHGFAPKEKPTIDTEYFDEELKIAVRRFQTAMAAVNPAIKADGVIGDQTWSLLLGAKPPDALEAGTRIVNAKKTYEAPAGVKFEHMVEAAAREFGGDVDPAAIRALAARLETDSPINATNTDPTVAARVALGLSEIVGLETNQVDVSHWLGIEAKDPEAQQKIQIKAAQMVDEIGADPAFAQAVNAKAATL